MSQEEFLCTVSGSRRQPSTLEDNRSWLCEVTPVHTLQPPSHSRADAASSGHPENSSGSAYHMVSEVRAEGGVAGSDITFSSSSVQDQSLEGNGSSYLSIQDNHPGTATGPPDAK